VALWWWGIPDDEMPKLCSTVCLKSNYALMVCLIWNYLLQDEKTSERVVQSKGVASSGMLLIWFWQLFRLHKHVVLDKVIIHAPVSDRS
jgi:hypothetical protein